MDYQEKVRQLCEEFSKRVPKFTLSIEECDTFLKQYPTMLMLEAMKRTGHSLRQNKRANQSSVLSTFERKLQFLLAEGLAKGAHRPYAKQSPEVQPEAVTEEQEEQRSSRLYEKILRVRQAFQDQCSDGTWCINEDDAKQFLKQRSEKIVLKVLSELNKTYAESDAQLALDEIEWLLSQSPK